MPRGPPPSLQGRGSAVDEPQPPRWLRAWVRHWWALRPGGLEPRAVGWWWVQLSHQTETAGVPAGDSGRPQAGEPLRGGNLGQTPNQRVSDTEFRSLVTCGRDEKRGPGWLGLWEGGQRRQLVGGQLAGRPASLRVHQGPCSLPEAKALGPEVFSVASCREKRRSGPSTSGPLPCPTADLPPPGPGQASVAVLSPTNPNSEEAPGHTPPTPTPLRQEGSPRCSGTAPSAPHGLTPGHHRSAWPRAGSDAPTFAVNLAVLVGQGG